MKASAHLIRAVCEFCGEPIPSKLEDMFDTSGPVEPVPYTGPGVDWLPLVGSDGAIAFHFTNDGFAATFLPTVQIIFHLLGLDRKDFCHSPARLGGARR